MENIITAWRGHEFFATWLVKKMKPTTIVDLGVDYGFSTFSWGLPRIGNVYGIDSFEGDFKTGFRNTYDSVNYMRQNLGLEDNVHIIKGKFDQISESWDNPIDILHIDGSPEYLNVKNDFDNWYRHVKDDGIVLFHDTCIYNNNFGVWKFFNELPLPKLNFTHSAGLGIATKNMELLGEIYETFF
jgi:predicted O-methyltransferase YrrM